MKKKTIHKRCVIGMIVLVFGMNIITITTSTSEIRTSTLPLLTGDTLYVGGNGPGNYSSIQAAIDNASTGDTVFVFTESSPYVENIIIKKSITVEGESKESTIIDGGREGDVVNISANHVTITGFTIRYSGKYNAGITLHSSYNVIEDNRLSRNSDGIYLTSSHNNIITGNDIQSDDKDLYLVDTSTDNIIDDNTIRGGWAGIYVRDSCDRNRYSHNTVAYCTLGIGILDSRDSILVSNTVHNTKYGMGIDNANHSIISDNIITDNKENGIGIYDSIGAILSNNTFEHDGLCIKNSFYNTVSNNTVNDCPLVYLEGETQLRVPSGAGQIILVNCSKISIENQTIANTSYAIVLSNSHECTIQGNALSNNTKDIYLEASYNNALVNNSVDAKDFYSISLYHSHSNNISENKVNGILETSAIFLEYSNNNTIARNIFTNHSIISILRSDENTVIGNIMSTGSGHIALQLADNNKIIGNTITVPAGSLGITVYVSDSNIISENTITNRVYGIRVERSHRNTISRNDITYNDQGVSLEESQFNIISNNNFIKNTVKDASCADSIPNLWRSNYWGRPRILPKLIPGTISIYREWPLPPMIIPLPSFDWHPARTLNKIP